MQYINDDMDELFRRAAENYPLNTNSADWKEVQKKLIAAGIGDQGTVVTKKTFNKRLLLLLLLLPAIWIYVNSVQQQKQQSSKKVVDKNVSLNSASSNSSVPSNGSVSLKSNVTSETVSPESVSSKSKIKVNTSVDDHAVPAINENRNNQPGKALAYQGPGGVKATVTQPATSTFGGNDKSQSIPLLSPVENKTDEAIAQIPTSENKKDIRVGNQTIGVPVISADIIDPGNPQQRKTAGSKKEQKKERPSLYAGFVFSPDVSTVKMQRVQKMGTGFGLKLGYQFNKKISLESGILFDKKIYYSAGEYVNTKRISVPSYSSVKNVNGVCRMIEIPLDMKYNISKPGKTVFSVSAGVASYFMQKEIYDYTYDYTTWQGHGRTTYKKSSSDLLAVMNFSVGYNHKVNKNTTLLVAPYLKIPFKGVGIGSLPITSTGVNIGIIRKLFTF